ncbi:radical SAM family heme chaperone HemW [Myxococcota bacterium]
MSTADHGGSQLGLYVHVPFCVSRCPYCDFNSVARDDPPWESYTTALRAELRARAPRFRDSQLQSIYVGGGTPSLAPASALTGLVDCARDTFRAADVVEVTVEVNPADLDGRGFETLRAGGFDRLSIGWQSSADHVLHTLGRRHSAAEGAACVALARRAGFDNVSVDLMFGVQGQTLDDLNRDLDGVVELGVEHVSTYGLTFHDDTDFGRRLRAGELATMAEDDEVEMMLRIEERLSGEGYERYEVSNYARRGRRAVHNSLYWTGVEYLGLGAGAHSFVRRGWQRGWRWESRRDPDAYIQAWQRRASSSEGLPGDGDGSIEWIEELTPRQMMTERMLCGLRTVEGVDLDEPVIAAHRNHVERCAIEATKRDWAARVGNRLRPTSMGLMNADALAALFF